MGIVTTTIETLREPSAVYAKVNTDKTYVNKLFVQSIVGILIFSVIYGFIYGISVGGSLKWAIHDLIRFPAVFFAVFLMTLLPFGFVMAAYNISWDTKQAAAVIGNILMITCVVTTSFAFFILFGSVALKDFTMLIELINLFIVIGSLIFAAFSFGRWYKIAFKSESKSFVIILFILIIFALFLAAIAIGPFSGGYYSPRIVELGSDIYPVVCY